MKIVKRKPVVVDGNTPVLFDGRSMPLGAVPRVSTYYAHVSFDGDDMKASATTYEDIFRKVREFVGFGSRNSKHFNGIRVASKMDGIEGEYPVGGNR